MKKKSSRFGVLVVTLVSQCVYFGTVVANDKPANVEADKLEYNHKTSEVSAEGHVVVTYDHRKLEAHKVTYNQKTDTITADTNIHVIDDHGNHFFADSAKVNGKITDGEMNMIG